MNQNALAQPSVLAGSKWPARGPVSRGGSIMAALAVAAIAAVSPTHAFHEGGVAACEGCHIMHGTEDGAPSGPGALTDGALRADNATDLCLLCHADSLGSVLVTNPLAPPPELGAGNFVFLLEDNLNDAPNGLTSPIAGDAAGHNLVAPARGLGPDPRHSVSPGGSFPAGEMGCTACHDPHGRDTFRLLYGAGPVLDGRFSFSAPAPEAEGLALDSAGESLDRHTAYRRGVSEWCGNCHGRYHDEGRSDFEHPADEGLGGSERDQYNRYEGDASPDTGTAATAYLPEVPFEDPAATTSSRSGPTGSSRVMCLSCHRAHATSSPAAGRWDFKVAILGDDGQVSGSYPIPSPFPPAAQGPLCTKCHEGGPPD